MSWRPHLGDSSQPLTPADRVAVERRWRATSEEAIQQPGRPSADPVPSLTTQELASWPCAALLGEPGTGKSVELRVLRDLELAAGRRCEFIDLRAFSSEGRLAERLARVDQEVGNGLTLFYDSLDEGLLQVGTLANILAGWAEKQEPARLRLRVACRTGAWPTALKRALQRWSPRGEPPGVFIGHLQPLDLEDAGEIAAQEVAEAADFLGAVRRAGAIALAERPVTLKLLVRLYKRQAALPASRWELYDKATRLLAAEWDPDRVAKEVAGLDPYRAQQVAGLVASATLLGNRATVAAYQDAEDGEALSLIDLIDMIHSRGLGADVSMKEARIVLASGLFDAAGTDGRGLRRWAHRSFAEFLAARDLRARDLPFGTLLSLLCLPGDQAPIPQLHELVAWLAPRVPELRDHIAGVQPEVLLRCDPTGLRDEERAALVDAILSACAAKKLSDSRAWTDHLTMIVHPEIGEQLRAWLPHVANGGRTDDRVARRIAMMLAREARSEHLAPILGAIARDPDDDPVVRGRAAHALERLESDMGRAELRPLLSWDPDDDPQRELLGLALYAWGSFLDCDDLFSALSALPDHHYIGTYYSFVHQELPGIVQVKGWQAEALDWLAVVSSHHEAEYLGVFGRSVSEKLLAVAWERLDGAVLDAMVRLLFTFAATYSRAPLPAEGLAEDEHRRRKLADALILAASADAVRASLFRHTAQQLLQPQDLSWLMDRFLARCPGQPDLLSGALIDTARIDRSDHCDLILSRAEQHSEVRELFWFWTKTVELGSPEAEKQREWYGPRRPARPPLDAQAHIQQALDQGRNDPGQWWRLIHALTLQPGDTSYRDAWSGDVEELPGWKGASPASREVIGDLARRYLEETPTEKDGWLGLRSFPWTVLAGVRALQLVHHTGASLSAEAWTRWAGVVIDHCESVANPEECQELVDRCTAAVPAEATRLALRLVEVSQGESPRGELAVRRALRVRTPEVTTGLLIALRARSLDEDADFLLIDELAGCGVLQALEIARDRLATSTTPVALASSAARALIRHGNPADWDAWWPRFSHDDGFAQELTGLMAHWAHRRGGEAFERHAARRLGKLYRRLVQLYPRREDPEIREMHGVGIREEITELRDRIPSLLADRADAEDIQELEALCSENEVLRWRLDEARAKNRATRWEPSDLGTLMASLLPPRPPPNDDVPRASGDMIFNAPVTISGGQVGTGTQVQLTALPALAHDDEPRSLRDLPGWPALVQLMRHRADQLPSCLGSRTPGRQLIELYVELDLETCASLRPLAGPMPREQSLDAVLGLDDLHWSIAGEPGSGKSTLLQVTTHRLLAGGACVPVLLSVSELVLAGSVAAALARAVEEDVPGTDPVSVVALIEAAVRAGSAVLLLDGLDEEPDSAEARRAIRGAVAELACCRVVVAGRTVAFEPQELGSGFRKLILRPLDPPRAEELLFLRTGDRALAKALLDSLREAGQHAVISNPLLLVLVETLAAEAGPDELLPARRVELYKRLVPLLLDPRHREDAAGRPVPRFQDPTSARRALEEVALAVHATPGQQVSVAVVAEALKVCGCGYCEGGPRAFIARAKQVTGLLSVRERLSGDFLLFSHRTLREFLAASALANAARQGGLGSARVRSVLDTAYAEPAAWAEVLALAAGLLSQPENALVRPTSPWRRLHAWLRGLLGVGPYDGRAVLDALVREAAQRSPTLAYRLVAEAERLEPATISTMLELDSSREAWEKRGELLQRLSELAGDFRVALGLVRRFLEASGSSHGSDLFWARELSQRILAGELAMPADPAQAHAVRADARMTLGVIFDHLPDADGRARHLRALLHGRWRPVPAGSFRMGSTMAPAPNREPNESPLHLVHVMQGFHMLAVPVTNAMYECFDPGHQADRELDDEGRDVSDHPVVNVSWYEASMFAEWAARVLGELVRLPTETEWEYACRGTTALDAPYTRFWSGREDDDLLAVDWALRNSGFRTHAVDELPSPRGLEHSHGLLHLHGNVWEWCGDSLGGDYEALEPEREHVPAAASANADSLAYRAFRGGCFFDTPQRARSACRNIGVPTLRCVCLGFRLVLLPGPA